jgi:hypothetical protein
MGIQGLMASSRSKASSSCTLPLLLARLPITVLVQVSTVLGFLRDEYVVGLFITVFGLSVVGYTTDSYDPNNDPLLSLLSSVLHIRLF